MTALRKIHAEIVVQHAELLEVLSFSDNSNALVSNWSAHKQVEHLILVNEGVLNSIEKATSVEAPKPLSLLGRFILTIGRIPRGKAKAPKFSVPEQNESDDLLERCQLLLQRFETMSLSKLSESKVIVANHPYFGGLNSKQWLRLIQIHNKHHLKIVEDILTATKAE